MRRRSGKTAALGLLFGLAGCVDRTPAVAFVQPADGDTVCGDLLQVELALTHFELVSEYSGDLNDLPDDQGHAHFYLNGQYLFDTTTPVTQAYQAIDDGYYQFEVELALLNHEPVDPPVTDTITMTIQNSLCEGGS